MELQFLIPIAVFCGAFIGGVILAIAPKLKSLFKHKHFNHNPLDTLARDMKIQDKLAELRVKIGANRVYIAKFHNGEEFFDGMSIKKISKTHETCYQGVSHEFLSCQNIMTSLVPEAMSIVALSKKTGNPIIKCTKSLSEGGFLNNHLTGLGIKTFGKYRLLIGERLVGYIGMHFKEEKCDIGSEKLQIIKEMGGVIENIFATNPKDFEI